MLRIVFSFAAAALIPSAALALGPQDLAELAAANSVPEIDALAGVSAVALIGASLALIRARLR